MNQIRLIHGDVRAKLSAPGLRGVAQVCVTSPPYWKQKSYLPGDHPMKALEIGQEGTPEEYIENLLDVFDYVAHVLDETGVLWVNIDDKSVNGNMLGIPFMFQQRMTGERGWHMTMDCIWRKPNAVPRGGQRRPSRNHEYIFMFVRNLKTYYYNPEANLEPLVEGSDIGYRLKLRSEKKAQGGYNEKEGGSRQNYVISSRTDGMKYRRSVWNINTDLAQHTTHGAVFPPELARIAILACSRPGDTVLEPFNGSGTSGAVAVANGRNYIGCDIDEDELRESYKRIRASIPRVIGPPTVVLKGK